MKIAAASLYALQIPFVAPFQHALAGRAQTDSVIVKLTAQSGHTGFGESAPRRYVTGETTATVAQYLGETVLPRLPGLELDAPDGAALWPWLDRKLQDVMHDAPTASNACRCAVELALLDCLLRVKRVPLGHLLPPQRPHVVYSGVIGAGPRARVVQAARRCRDIGFTQIKMKITGTAALPAVALVRDIVGPCVSIRLDANAAFSLREATGFLKAVAAYDIACVEQPLPRGNPAAWAALKRASPIPLMADESLVTQADAADLLRHGSVDCFNLRVSKCGGLQRTLPLAHMATAAGVSLQVGCQVGETAILSAAGRCLAAHLDTVQFTEGSYGTHLLREDISVESMTFGPGGIASLPTGPGLGVTIDEGVLAKHARVLASHVAEV